MTHTYIIAEAGVNHNGDADLAFALVDAAAAAGADAVKFQTFKAEQLTTISAPKAAYQRQTTDKGESQLAMLKKLELGEALHRELASYCHKQQIQFLSTAFDHNSLRFLQRFDLPCYKIPSGEITNGPLLWAYARLGKPLLLSTGMSTLSEVEQALAVLAHGMLSHEQPTALSQTWKSLASESGRQLLQERVTLLHCTSQYPTPAVQVNLRAMDTLSQAFHLPVGYSDHTLGITVPVAAVARGAQVIEKHFTLDRSMPGPDHKASLEPAEFKQMVEAIRFTEQSMGSGYKQPQSSEFDTRLAARQVLVAATDIQPGELFTADNLITRRAGAGLSPMQLWERLGQPAPRGFATGEPIS